MKYTNKIIDAHMHLWDYNSGNYPWLDAELPGADIMLGEYSSLRRNYFAKDYVNDTDAFDVENSVHIQVFGYPENPVLETAWVTEQSKEFGMPKRIVGFVDLSDKNADKQIEKQMEYKTFIGVRNVLCYHDVLNIRMTPNKDIFSDVDWINGFSHLVKNNLTFDTQIFDLQIPQLMNVIKKFPETKIMINHLGWPTDFSKNGFETWKKNIQLLKPFENVFIKISALGCIFKKLDTVLIYPYLSEILNTIGVDRCCIGSNFPVDGLFFTFNNLYQFYDSFFSQLTLEKQKKLYCDNAKYFYSIK